MKLTPPHAALVLAALFVPIASLHAAGDRAVVGANVKRAVAQDPTRVLVILEDALSANPGYACEIVKSAIQSSNADKELIKQIVITAVSTVEDQAATIAECAVAVAPEAAKAIKLGLEEALGQAVIPVGKGKAVPEPYVGSRPDEGYPILISGVYLMAPVLSGATVETIIEEVPVADEDPPDDRTTPPPASPAGLTAARP